MNVTHPSVRLCLVLAHLLSGLTAGDDDLAERDVVVTYAMMDDPLIELPPPVIVLPPEYSRLWVQTLDAPDLQLQQQVTMAIERAHRLGYADLSAAIPRLREMLQDSEAQQNLRVSAAVALLTLEDRDSAAAILELSESAGPSLAPIAEPTLARWKYEPAISRWLSRLDDVGARRLELRLAVESLMTANESRAVSGLKSIVLDSHRASTIRLAAARSLGAIQRSGLEELASQTIGEVSPREIRDRLIGATLLRYHEGPEAAELLLVFAADPEPAIAAIAWERLLEIDSSLLMEIAGSALQNPDTRIREYAVRAVSDHPTNDRLITLAVLLSDPHPGVRNLVRRTLRQHAENGEFDRTIREQAVRILQEDDWRGIEQAGMLLAALDHDVIAPNLLELLEHPRTEVAVMAAWGLRVLAVPETLPPMLAYAQQVTDNSLPLRREFFDQCAHLFEAFGLMRFHEAEPLLRQFVSKNPPPRKEDYSRGAAIWALGLLHEGSPDRGLTRQLIGRIQDTDSEEPESEFVRRFAAITIGRMQDESAMPALLMESGDDVPPVGDVDYACRWAIEQITGKPIRQPVPVVRQSSNWFLVPLELEEPDR